MDMSGMTAEDRFVLERVYLKLQAARLDGTSPFFVAFLNDKMKPIGLPFDVRACVPAPVQASAAQKKPAKDFDPEATVYGDSMDATLTEADDLTHTDEAILKVLDESSKPLKIATIATRASCNFNSHFRQKVRALVKKGILQVIDEHYYWPAERPFIQD